MGTVGNMRGMVEVDCVRRLCRCRRCGVKATVVKTANGREFVMDSDFYEDEG